MSELTFETRKHTLVYWNVSFLPVNVASMECGAVSISQIPGAAQIEVHKCSCLWFANEGEIRPPRQHYTPAKMDCARVETVHVILVCTQTFAQLALNGTEAGVALMKGMIDVTSNEHVHVSDITTKKGSHLGIRHVPGHEYTLLSTSCTSERSHG